jgi:hypothetical protein
MFKLIDTLTRSLVTQPETGMGYQLVEATLLDNKIKRGIAFNAELLVFDDEKQEALRMYPYTNPYTTVLKRSAESSGSEIKTLRVLPLAGISDGVREAARALQKKAGPAKDAPKETTKADEVFKRFCAYQNDRRVTPDGRLLPNSYATTDEDAK